MACLLLPSFAQAGLNKWVDKKGQIHYGDRVPSEYLRKEHYLLNEQGVTLRTSEAMKTDEELTADKKKEKIKAAETRKKMIAARKKMLRDRVLLDTFTTENDLMIARDARIDAINSQISLAETLIKHDEGILKKAKERVGLIEKSGREAPENLYKKVISVGRQLENNYAYIEDKNNERDHIFRTFHQDVSRFRELKKLKREARERERERLQQQ